MIKGAIGRWAWIAIALLLCIVAFVVYRLREYERREPVREGISALKAGDASTALKKLTPFAESGDVLAQRTIAEIYAYGEGVPADHVQAGIWFRRAECSCKPTGRFEYTVALNYLEGRAPGPNKQNAHAAGVWLQRAAEAGHPEAQRVLANPSELAAKGLTIDRAISDYWKRNAR